MAAGAQGVQRVFLRLCTRSPLLPEATAVGFLAYQKEQLFQAPGLQEGAALPSVPPEVRPRSAADDHPLFRLYQAATSASVRSAEGMTFQEWQDARETRWGQGSEHVYEREGQLLGWLRLTEAEKVGHLDALVRPDDGAVAAALVDLARASLGNKAAVVSLVREGDVVLEATLRERGFEPVEEYVSLVKQVAARVRAPCLIPAGA